MPKTTEEGLSERVTIWTCCYKVRKSRVPSSSKFDANPSIQRDLKQLQDLCETTFVGLQAALLTVPGLFVLCCVLAVFLLEYIIPLETQKNTPVLQFSVNYLTGWPLILWSCIGLLTVLITFRRPKSGDDSPWIKSLSQEDAAKASWYFCNGFFFNSMMDVFAGQLQSWPIMSERYVQLEPRYGMSETYDGVTVILTSLQEICIQAPLGLVLFYGFWRNKSWRAPLEIVFNMWSVAGVLYFYGSEFMLKFPHVHSPYDENKVFQWENAFGDFDTIYKFWIGFVLLPGLWAVVGIWFAAEAISELSTSVEEVSSSNTTQRHKKMAERPETKFIQAQKDYIKDLKLELKNALKQVKSLQKQVKSNKQTPSKSRTKTKTPKRKSARKTKG